MEMIFLNTVKTEVCSAHYIREKVVEQLVLESMQRVLWYVQSYEKIFAQRQLEEFSEKQRKSLLKSAGSLIRQSSCAGD